MLKHETLQAITVCCYNDISSQPVYNKLNWLFGADNQCISIVLCQAHISVDVYTLNNGHC